LHIEKHRFISFQNKTGQINLRRFFIELSYNGANYSGWQIQANAPSVQATIQEVMQRILRKPIEIAGSSRTDTGVHALHQVAQVDFEPGMESSQLVFLMNQALPPDISILDLYEVSGDTKARFDAISRSYLYVVCRRKDPFWYNRSFLWKGDLNLEILHEAAKVISETTDFESFCKIHTDVNHFDCNIKYAGWREEGHLVYFEITANRFLRGMVRGLVGTMMAMGKGQLSLTEFIEIIKSKDRKKAGENAPAYGLYLTKVEYEPTIRKPTNPPY
jgi:tRNA pseudouridine38-40 synthase